MLHIGNWLASVSQFGANQVSSGIVGSPAPFHRIERID
jgi:hypothetical protein